ncbi:LOB domain-containing protein 24-like [Alnus glutinosa]|uniref:LOB domain-containing protein 24-like n=1 Tax=Alnus glutinosa TaxID=3517 RepID=UPI002D7949A5|nr:LOB domain-containing protein 24-like [Alnus glutinosa]
MISARCAACKYLRRRCHSDCIFSLYFPPNDPQRFASVHKIYGASNVAKILQQLPLTLRAQAAETLYFEAKCRIEDPVYGCVGIISQLYQQLHNGESELAKTQAEIAFLNCNPQVQPIDEANSSNFNNLLPHQYCPPSTPNSWFN